MELEVGPYKLSQRTEYSKLQVFDKNDKNISNTKIGQKIIDDYNRQLKNPKKYFYIEHNELLNLLDGVAEDNIKYLFIPNGVNTIENDALECEDFEYISLPDTLRTIGAEAFCGCENLKYIKIPNTVTALYDGCFKWCESLETIILPEVEILSKEMFEDCVNLCNITLPNSLESIERTCFLNCSNIKKITIPDSVKNIGRSAFLGCKMLESIKLPNDLKIIDIGTFGDCNNLKEISIPETVYEIRREAFFRTKHLKEINIPRDLRSIGWSPFFESEITTLIFNHDLKRITGTDSYGNPANLITHSKIEKFVISKNVKKITSTAVGVDGGKITKIDYLGSKEEFEEFKENNKALFNLLKNLKEINFFEEKIRGNTVEKQIR